MNKEDVVRMIYTYCNKTQFYGFVLAEIIYNIAIPLKQFSDIVTITCSYKIQFGVEVSCSLLRIQTELIVKFSGMAPPTYTLYNFTCKSGRDIFFPEDGKVFFFVSFFFVLVK